MSEVLPSDEGDSLRRFGMVQLLIAIAALFISMPFIEALRSGSMIEAILMTIVLLSGVLAIADRRRVVIVGLILVGPAIIGRWVDQYRPGRVPAEVYLIAAILFFLFVIINLLRFVLNAPSVDTEVLCASISAYLLLGFTWALAYWLVAELVPNAFAFSNGDKSLKGFNGVYYSFITMCSVGYGDITPVAKVARMLAAAEAVTGSLYIAVLVARLVSLYASPKSS